LILEICYNFLESEVIIAQLLLKTATIYSLVVFLALIVIAPHTAFAQGETVTATVYLPLILSPEPPPLPCHPPLSEMGLRSVDLPPGFVLELEAGGVDLLSAEVQTMGATDVCSVVYVSFLWMLEGELGVVGSQVIEFDNLTGPDQYLALVQEAALADPAVSLLPDVSVLGEETVATRIQTEEGLTVYTVTFRSGCFVGRLAGGGLVDLGIEVLMGYGELVAGRFPMVEFLSRQLTNY
jgi:hypothetical protein